MSVKNKRLGPLPNNMPRVVPARAETVDDDKIIAHKLRKKLNKAKALLRKLDKGLFLPRWVREEIAEILAEPEH